MGLRVMVSKTVVVFSVPCVTTVLCLFAGLILTFLYRVRPLMDIPIRNVPAVAMITIKGYVEGSLKKAFLTEYLLRASCKMIYEKR